MDLQILNMDYSLIYILIASLFLCKLGKGESHNEYPDIKRLSYGGYFPIKIHAVSFSNKGEQTIENIVAQMFDGSQNNEKERKAANNGMILQPTTNMGKAFSPMPVNRNGRNLEIEVNTGIKPHFNNEHLITQKVGSRSSLDVEGKMDGLALPISNLKVNEMHAAQGSFLEEPLSSFETKILPNRETIKIDRPSNDEARKIIRRKRYAGGVRHSFNEKGCYLLADQKTRTFIAVTETSLDENYNFCGSTKSRNTGGGTCYSKVLYSTHTPTEACKLQTSNTLDLCLIFSAHNLDHIMRFHCQIPLGPVHVLHGIEFNEQVYVRYCSHIPIYLTHFPFHSLNIIPFLSKEECNIIHFLKSHDFVTYRSQGQLERIQILPKIEHFITPICVMETSMRKAFHCQIDFQDWKGKLLTECPPPGCIPDNYDPTKTYECIPYIQRHVCFSRYIHESGVCLINTTDDTYTVCKALTPHTMQTKMTDMYFDYLVRQCFLEMYPGHEYDLAASIEFFKIPLDTFPLTPLKEMSCMESYRFLQPEINGRPEVSKRAVSSVEKRRILSYVGLGILGIGAIFMILICLDMRKMLHQEYRLVVVDIYVIIAFCSLVADWIIQVIINTCHLLVKLSDCAVAYTSMYST